MADSNRNQEPAYFPVKCVVCNGFGTVNWGRSRCHACGGKGYLLMPTKEEIGDSYEKDND